MKQDSRTPFRALGPVVPILGLALLAGCATIPANDCERFERVRQSMDYDTTYVYSEAETRRAAPRFARPPRGAHTAVGWYTLRASPARIRACDHLYLVKDLYLQRIGNEASLEEQREFYTADGYLIATKHENLTHQLRKPGYYTALVPLPIPEQAPPGTYRVVMRFVGNPGTRAQRVLAETSAEFRVLR